MQARELDLNVDDRVTKIIEQALLIYLTKVKSNFLECNNETDFQIQFGLILDAELKQHTYLPDESFRVLYEVNMPLSPPKKNKVDIVLAYTCGEIEFKYAIELKHRKKVNGAVDLGIVESYIDLMSLDILKYRDKKIKNGYFIFLTDDESYLTYGKTKSEEIPRLVDGNIIEKGRKYFFDTESTRREASKKFKDGFIFIKEHKIAYQELRIKGMEDIINTDKKSSKILYFMLTI